jgi:hypothetical protein
MSRNILRGICLFSMIVVAAFGVAACGEEDPGMSTGGLGQVSKAQQKQDYQGAMLAMSDSLEDPNSAMPLAKAVRIGNRNELQGAAERWDQATAIAAGIQAPKDIAAAHAMLVQAMKDLGDWNRRIAAAAPNAKKTRALGKRAQNSDAAKRYNQALAKIQAAGYSLTPEDDPLESAGSPGE